MLGRHGLYYCTSQGDLNSITSHYRWGVAEIKYRGRQYRWNKQFEDTFAFVYRMRNQQREDETERKEFHPLLINMGRGGGGPPTPSFLVPPRQGGSADPLYHVLLVTSDGEAFLKERQEALVAESNEIPTAVQGLFDKYDRGHENATPSSPSTLVFVESVQPWDQMRHSPNDTGSTSTSTSSTVPIRVERRRNEGGGGGDDDNGDAQPVQCRQQ